MNNPDPGTISLAHLALATAVVVGLLALLAIGLKYLNKRILPTAGTHRLKVVDSLMIDMRRRLVIVRSDDTEHLLLLGDKQDLVIESSLKSAETAPLSTKDRT